MSFLSVPNALDAPHEPPAVMLGASSSADVLARLLPLLIVLVVIVVIGAVVISFARRGLLDKPKHEVGAIELDRLRELRDSGALTRGEYETARDALIGRSSREKDKAERKGGSAARRRIAADGSIVAAPGFDLTGEPLPEPPAGKPDEDDDEPHDDPTGSRVPA